MTTVREAAVTKLGNPLCGKPHVELTLRGMLPAIDNVECGIAANWKEMVTK